MNIIYGPPAECTTRGLAECSTLLHSACTRGDPMFLWYVSLLLGKLVDIMYTVAVLCQLSSSCVVRILTPLLRFVKLSARQRRIAFDEHNGKTKRLHHVSLLLFVSWTWRRRRVIKGCDTFTRSIVLVSFLCKQYMVWDEHAEFTPIGREGSICNTILSRSQTHGATRVGNMCLSTISEVRFC
jgi:hypothetical protein